MVREQPPHQSGQTRPATNNHFTFLLCGLSHTLFVIVSYLLFHHHTKTPVNKTQGNVVRLHKTLRFFPTTMTTSVFQEQKRKVS